MNFSIAKLASGFAFWKGENFGKILFFVIMFCLCMLGYQFSIGVRQKLTQETTSVAQADTVNIDQRQESIDKEKLFLGVKLWGLRLGLSFQQRSTVSVEKADSKMPSLSEE